MTSSLVRRVTRLLGASILTGAALLPWVAAPTASARPAIPIEIGHLTLPSEAVPACPLDRPLPQAPMSQVAAEAERAFGIELIGTEWRQERHRDLVALFWQTFDSLDCTPFLDRAKQNNGGRLRLSSAPTRTSWAWGDYSLTEKHTVTFDFTKFQQGLDSGQRQRIIRLVTHEIGHVFHADRGANPKYWTDFEAAYDRLGPISRYGRTDLESWGDAVGYYVARCDPENPYRDAKFTGYYNLIRDNVFGGREFGPPPGTAPLCLTG